MTPAALRSQLIRDIVEYWPSGMPFLGTLDLVRILADFSPMMWGDGSPAGRLTSKRLAVILGNEPPETRPVRVGGVMGRWAGQLVALRESISDDEPPPVAAASGLVLQLEIEITPAALVRLERGEACRVEPILHEFAGDTARMRRIRVTPLPPQGTL